MTTRSLRRLFGLPLLCLLAAFLARPETASAQQPWPGEAQPAPAQRSQPRSVPPVVGEEDQLSPRQMQSAPGRQQARPPRPADATPRPAQPAARSIACSGVFGKDSTHLKLAIAFDSRNLTFAEVDGPEGTKLNASVVFPNDPKRRLEVLWQNEAARADTALIVINGSSQWGAPKGLRLGMALAALEKANGKPFNLAGLDQANGGSVLDWNGGALASLPGGCKIGVRLAVDPKTPDTARAAAGGASIMSSDPSLKAVKLGITEIIIGY